MKFNTGATAEERGSNCALCTAGGLTGQSSGDVMADLHIARGWFESDAAFGEYCRVHHPGQRVRSTHQDLADQFVGLMIYVGTKLRTNARFCGTPTAPVRAAEALPFMNRQPVGTLFAVFTSDGGFFGVDAHWIAGERTATGVSFTDYQTDHQLVPTSSPTVSAHPMAPDGVPYVRDGASNPNTYMIVIAFGNNLVP